MNEQREMLSINYQGQPVNVICENKGVDTFFSVQLPEDTVELKMEYIDDNPCWTESGNVTERAEELGRLIEESDGR